LPVERDEKLKSEDDVNERKETSDRTRRKITMGRKSIPRQPLSDDT
jgi:hypothetical protein